SMRSPSARLREAGQPRRKRRGAMSRSLPTWTADLVPIDMDGAATLLGISRRFLVDVIRKHRHYEPRGNRKVFYPEHIALLRDALKCPTSSPTCVAAFGTPLEPSTESAYEKALALATGKP